MSFIPIDTRLSLEENWEWVEKSLVEGAERGLNITPLTVFNDKTGKIKGWDLKGWEPPPATVFWKAAQMPDNLKNFEVFAWVGEDEFGTGDIGLKQALVPAGCVPLVSVDKDNLSKDYIIKQLEKQVAVYGKTVRLIKLTFAEEVLMIEGKENEILGNANT